MNDVADMDSPLAIDVPAPVVVEAVPDSAAATDMNVVDGSGDLQKLLSKQHEEPHEQRRKVFGVTLPQGASDSLNSISRWSGRWRKGAIEKAPRAVVNNSSNIMGMIQIVAELFMFK